MRHCGRTPSSRPNVPAPVNSPRGRYRLSPRRARYPAFTLVELLVVVSIIAVLLSIMSPAYQAALRTAHQNTCANNHHQLIVATMAYGKDYRQRLPFCNSRALESSGRVEWPGWLYDYDHTAKNGTFTAADRQTGTLWPYLQKGEVYRCPAEAEPWSGANAITSYVMNRSSVADSYNGETVVWRSTDIIAFAGDDAVLFWEAADEDWNDGCSYPNQGLTQRHGDGATVGCVGGHTDHMTHVEYEIELYNQPGRLYCNPRRSDGL